MESGVRAQMELEKSIEIALKDSERGNEVSRGGVCLTFKLKMPFKKGAYQDFEERAPKR